MLARLKLSPAGSRPTIFKQTWRAPVLGCLALLGNLLAVDTALAHGRLVRSAPGDGSHAPSPAAITLTFNEPVKPIFVRLKRAGRLVDPAALVAPAVDGAVLLVALTRSLEAGDYVIEYRVVTTDTHPISGTISFRVN